MKRVVIIGLGASGLMAGIYALKNGATVIAIEKNEKAGKKLYITGKGRCNLTNNTEVSEFIKKVVVNSKFIYSAINHLTPFETYNFFEENGLKLKVERGQRVFPLSDKASDVTKTLERYLIKNGATLKYNEEVLSVKKVNDIFYVKTNLTTYVADSVIICTGGISYPTTGSTGDGYKFAKTFNHSIVSPVPALVGFDTLNGFENLSGLTLKNVELIAYVNGKKFKSEFGELLFTHTGISGPIVLTMSSYINRLDYENVKLFIDLKPNLTAETINERLLKEFSENKNKNLISIINGLMPKSLAEYFCKNLKFNPNKKVNEITKAERQKIVENLKHFQIEYKGLRPIKEAIITSGGVAVKEVDPKTMQSKNVKGLYFAGEVLDIDALTGGYNIQIAFSTGALAGESASK